MKTKLLTICLLLFTSQVFAFHITNIETENIVYGEIWHILHITLDNIDDEKKIRCIVYNDKDVAIGKGFESIYGIGKVIVPAPSSYRGARSFKCKEKKWWR